MPDAYAQCQCQHVYYLHDEETGECIYCDCTFFSPVLTWSEGRSEPVLVRAQAKGRRSIANVHRRV